MLATAIAIAQEQNARRDQNRRGAPRLLSAKMASHRNSLLFPPSDKLNLSFDQLSYKVVDRTRKKKSTAGSSAEKTLLKNVSGFIQGGTLMGILGPSGAGKTTLLDVISRRRKPSSGEVHVNGQHVSEKHMLTLSSYIQQTECIMGTQTVREAIEFAALLKLPKSFTLAQKKARVAEIIDQLHLNKCADTYVGDPLNPALRGVSGGERKRCSIGQSLVTNPHMIFLDEPLSGLDAYTAVKITQNLQVLAHKMGRTCVLTVHQPSSDVFALMDGLLLLVDGRVVYCGSAKASVEHFAKAGYPCPHFNNPADFIFMHVLSSDNEPYEEDNAQQRNAKEKAKAAAVTAIDGSQGSVGVGIVHTTSIVLDGAGNDVERGPVVRTASSRDANARTEELVDFWLKSEAALELQGQLDAYHSTPLRENGSNGPEHSRSSAAFIDTTLRPGFSMQFQVLFKRARGGLYRNPMRGRSLVAQYIAFGCIIAAIYGGIGKDQNSIQDRVGALFFIATNGLFAALMPTISTFANERAAFLRERQNGMYSTFAYFSSRCVVEYPLQLTVIVIYSTIMYWSVGFQRKADKFAVFLLLTVLEALAATHLGLFFAAVFSRVEVALAILPVFILPLMLFAGFFINTESLPVYLTWIQWLSPIKYAFAGYAQNEFDGLTFTCSDGELVVIPTTNFTQCRYATGAEFVETLNFQSWLSLHNTAIVLAALYIVCFFGGFLMLERLAQKHAFCAASKGFNELEFTRTSRDSTGTLSAAS